VDRKGRTRIMRMRVLARVSSISVRGETGTEALRLISSEYITESRDWGLGSVLRSWWLLCGGSVCLLRARGRGKGQVALQAE